MKETKAPEGMCVGKDYLIDWCIQDVPTSSLPPGYHCPHSGALGQPPCTLPFSPNVPFQALFPEGHCMWRFFPSTHFLYTCSIFVALTVICISYLACCNGQTPNKKQLKKGRVDLGSQFKRGYSPSLKEGVAVGVMRCQEAEWDRKWSQARKGLPLMTYFLQQDSDS